MKAISKLVTTSSAVSSVRISKRGIYFHLFLYAEKLSHQLMLLAMGKPLTFVALV